MKNEKLKIIVPISLELDWPDKAAIIAGIRELHRKYLLSWFGLACPCGGWRSSLEYPSLEYIQKKAELFHEIKAELEPEGIHCGWWDTLTIKSSPVPGWQRIVFADGSAYKIAACPLDPEYRKHFVNMMAQFAAIGKPEFILTEDDYGLHGGCFCERHLAEFSRREGREWTREALVEAMKNDKALNRRWRKLKCDTLAALAADVRAAVDVQSPEIPIGTCQSGSWDGDGDATEAVCRAFAGPRHHPFSRLYGTFYGGEDIQEIPSVLLHPLYYKQHLPEDFVCLHESDTFPHTRFFTSGACMRVLMSSVYSQGYDGSNFQAQQLLDNPNEENAYAKMHAEELARFQAMHDASKECSVKGISLPYKYADWTRCVSHFGFPYTTKEAPVTFLSGSQIELFSDEELTGFFKKGLVIDGDAADALFKRGFGKLMGCDVGPDAVSGKEIYDLGGREIIEPGFAKESIGRDMHRAGYFSPRGNGRSFALFPHEGAEIITRLFTFQKKEIGIGMLRFVNELGGRIVVMGMGTAGNQSSSLYNYRRQKLLQELAVWCGAGVVMVKNAARVFPVMNETNDPAEAGFTGMLTLSNLNADTLDEIELYLPEKWRGCNQWKRLDANGKWLDQTFTRTADGIKLPIPLHYARPEVFLVSEN